LQQIEINKQNRVQEKSSEHKAKIALPLQGNSNQQY